MRQGQNCAALPPQRSTHDADRMHCRTTMDNTHEQSERHRRASARHARPLSHCAGRHRPQGQRRAGLAGVERRDAAGGDGPHRACRRGGVGRLARRLFRRHRLYPQLVRDVNDDLAQVVADHPQRFAAVGLVSLPDVDSALRDVEYALDTLKLDGILLLTHTGRPLSWPSRRCAALCRARPPQGRGHRPSEAAGGERLGAIQLSRRLYRSWRSRRRGRSPICTGTACSPAIPTSAG